MSRILGLLFLLALLPFAVQSDFWLNSATVVLMLALLGSAWNVLGGYGGQFSFGHAAFFGTGAYAMAILQVRYGVNPWAAAPLAILAGAAMGGIIGGIAFRYGLRGSYFALVTLAFAEVLRILASAASLTGGGAGILVPLKLSPANFQFEERALFYWVGLALFGAGLVATWALQNSRFGAYLVAIRENEDAAQALGIDAFRVKLGATILSAAMAAAAGMFYTQLFLYLDSGIAYGPAQSIEALLIPLIGGLGTLFGPLLGAVILRALGEVTSLLAHGTPGLSLAAYGLLLLVMLRFLPNGIGGLLRRRRDA